jgi:hypothetical protein
MIATTKRRMITRNPTGCKSFKNSINNTHFIFKIRMAIFIEFLNSYLLLVQLAKEIPFYISE